MQAAQFHTREGDVEVPLHGLGVGNGFSHPTAKPRQQQRGVDTLGGLETENASASEESEDGPESGRRSLARCTSDESPLLDKGSWRLIAPKTYDPI